jgi:hypothetical protein
MIVINKRGEEFELTSEEEKFYKAVKRLEKHDQGRLILFGSGSLSIRINNAWADDEVDFVMGVFCEGGDGGDNH